MPDQRPASARNGACPELVALVAWLLLYIKAEDKDKLIMTSRYHEHER